MVVKSMVAIQLYYSPLFKYKIMPILIVLLVIVLVGVVLWAVNTYIPMDKKIKTILNIVVVIFLIVWLLSVFGILSNLMSIHV